MEASFPVSLSEYVLAYWTEATGTVVYNETQQTITNNFGLFTLAIGKGTVMLGTFPGINWGTAAKFLKVEIAPQGGVNFQLQGTTQLLSVPYALYSEKSGTSGLQGPAGINGLSILNGVINPMISTGVNGDFYINTVTDQLFGPKTNGVWSIGISLTGATGQSGVQGAVGPIGPAGKDGPVGETGSQGPVGLTGATGPAGPQGNTGAAGPTGQQGPAGGLNGTNGKTILNGTTNPAAIIGTDGDFYINTITNQIFGPKTAGMWDAGISLTGAAGPPGLKSLINLENFPVSPTCPLGGLIVKSGIDQNNNSILDVNEIDNTKTICFGQTASLDKVIIFPLFNSSFSTAGTSPYIADGLLKFNKNNYPQVDSAILVCSPYVADKGNTAIVKLYNVTDDIPIYGSTIISSHLPPVSFTGLNYLETGNLFSSLPAHDVTLGISLQSGNSGMYVYSSYGACFLYLYRR